MDSLKFSLFMFIFALAGCSESVKIEQRKWTDPVNGGDQIMEQVQLSPWQILTFPQNREGAVLIKKDNGPMFSYDTTGKSQTIMVHPKQESGHSSIDVTDSNNDGIFDRIRFFSGAESEKFTMYEANLVNGSWVINEHTKN